MADCTFDFFNILVGLMTLSCVSPMSTSIMDQDRATDSVIISKAIEQRGC